jgi:ribonuclease R
LSKDPHYEREAAKYENPIPSREFILEFLADLGRPASIKHIAKALRLDTAEQRDALSKRLGAMVRQGQLIVDRRNVYAIPEKVDLLKGKVSAHPDGYGFLIQEDGEDIFFTRREMRRVFHGDVVLARIRGSNRRGKTEGEIVEVVERNTQQLVGRYYIENGIELLEPLNKRINHEVIVKEARVKAKPGQIVVAEVTEQPGFYGVVQTAIVEVLGDHLTKGIEVDIALRNHDIPAEWSDAVLAEADQMPVKVTTSDKKDRFDLTELPFVTIDGEDARDFDDAVYCEQHEEFGWRLYVAIADVGHYVQPGSALDLSARERGTSVYFPQYVVPMLPHKLSNGLCSLNPMVERLVMVCEMELSTSGEVTSYDFYEGFIFSHARLTYEQVADALTHGKLREAEESQIEPVSKSLVEENLQQLEQLYNVLFRRRHQRGAIEFESTEVQFNFDDAGKVTSIVPRGRNKAHRIIEECMLCANVCAAKLLDLHEAPGLFRVHEPPEVEKLKALEGFLQQFGVRFQASDDPHPADFQAVTAKLQKLNNGHVLQMAVLRAMNQAVYQPENKGHFGLAYDAYAHFTSPIRRYPDLTMHRAIKAAIGKGDRHTLRLGPKPRNNPYPYDMAQVVELGELTSFAERRADAAVYEVLEYIKCEYISDRVGDVLPGVVTGVAKFGLFVELQDIYVEGLVHVSSLLGDYYRYDPEAQVLSGERTGEVYGMGDLVEAQIVRVNVDERKVDFELVSHTPLTRRGRPKQRKQKDGARSSQPSGRRGDKHEARKQKGNKQNQKRRGKSSQRKAGQSRSATAKRNTASKTKKRR